MKEPFKRPFSYQFRLFFLPSSRSYIADVLHTADFRIFTAESLPLRHFVFRLQEITGNQDFGISHFAAEKVRGAE